MVFKFVVVAAVLAVANAGYLGAPAAVSYPGAYAAPAAVAVATPSITSQHQNTLRSHGNLGQVSTYSKSIDTPYSSVRKSDVRVSNDALAYGAAPAYQGTYGFKTAYAAPAVATYAAAPAVATYAAAPALSGHYGAYAAAPLVAKTAYAAPAVAAPVLSKPVFPGSLIGVAYSAAPEVAHMTFSGYGINYGW